VGAFDQVVKVGLLQELGKVDLGKPLHSVVLIGKRAGPLERDALRLNAVDAKTFDEAWEKGNYGV